MLASKFPRKSFAGLLSVSISKEIRNAKEQFFHFWIYDTAKAFTFPLESTVHINKNRSTCSVGGLLRICASTRIRTSAIVLKGLYPDLLINNHNPDLLEIIQSGWELWRVSSPFRNVNSLYRSTMLKPLRYYSLGCHRMDHKNRRHMSEGPSYPKSRQTGNRCGGFWCWVQVSPRRMNRGGRP
jgi:hypothetical protein